MLGRVILSADKASVARNEDEDRQEGGCDNRETHDVEGILHIQLAEAKSEANSTCVTTSANDSGNGSGVGWVHVSVVGTNVSGQQ